MTIESGEPILYLKLDPQLIAVLHWGEEEPVLGWSSPAFGEKVPTVTLKGEKGMQSNLILKTILWMP